LNVKEEGMNKRHIARWLGLGAALAWVLGQAAAGRAQVAVRLDLGRHPGGSIRLGSPPPPRVIVPGAPVVVPALPPASVRYEHFHDRDRFGRPYWGPPRPGVVYRHPYSVAYLRRFRPGWRPIVIGPTQYYVYAAPPPGSSVLTLNGVSYYLSDGVYYQPYLYEGQTVYMVVPPPIP
jgi:hypothetical protein